VAVVLVILAILLGYFRLELDSKRRRAVTSMLWFALLCALPLWTTSASRTQLPALAALCTFPFLPVFLMARNRGPTGRPWLL
jgi:hypothetical protein